MLTAVIFDLNGVFLESRKLSERIHEDYGVNTDEFVAALKEVMDRVRKPNAPAVYSLWQPHFAKWKVDLKEPQFLDYWFSGEHLVPQLIDYAKELRASGLKIFILSNNFRERTTYYREKFPELFSCFDHVYFSWETGLVKSDPQAYLNLLAQNGLKADECIFFDDSQKNIELANSLGIRAYLYESLEKTKGILQAALRPPSV